MSKLLTYGSVGGAPGNRCIYPEIEGTTIYQRNSDYAVSFLKPGLFTAMSFLKPVFLLT